MDLVCARTLDKGQLLSAITGALQCQHTGGYKVLRTNQARTRNRVLGTFSISITVLDDREAIVIINLCKLQNEETKATENFWSSKKNASVCICWQRLIIEIRQCGPKRESVKAREVPRKELTDRGL